MTKYTIHDKVTRFVTRFGMVMDPETMNTARDEAGEYDFRKISEGHYAVQHGDKMYVLIEREDMTKEPPKTIIGCSCDDMTYNRMDGSCCKHIIAFSRLMSPITKEIDKADATHLMHVCGWTGRELHPEEIQIPPDPDLDLGVNDPLLEPGMLTGTCQYCGKEFKRQNVENLKQIVDEHEASCPERIESKEIEQEHEQKPQEEMKMEDKPAWNQEAWDSATQGSFATFDENGVAVVLFTANDFEMGKPDKRGRTTYEFAVIQNKTAVIFSVGSVRLMAALKTVLPLENKQIKITRVGEGMETTYKVEDVTDAEVN